MDLHGGLPPPASLASLLVHPRRGSVVIALVFPLHVPASVPPDRFRRGLVVLSMSHPCTHPIILWVEGEVGIAVKDEAEEHQRGHEERLEEEGRRPAQRALREDGTVSVSNAGAEGDGSVEEPEPEALVFA